MPCCLQAVYSTNAPRSSRTVRKLQLCWRVCLRRYGEAGLWSRCRPASARARATASPRASVTARTHVLPRLTRPRATSGRESSRVRCAINMSVVVGAPRSSQAFVFRGGCLRSALDRGRVPSGMRKTTGQRTAAATRTGTTTRARARRARRRARASRAPPSTSRELEFAAALRAAHAQRPGARGRAGAMLPRFTAAWRAAGCAAPRPSPAAAASPRGGTTALDGMQTGKSGGVRGVSGARRQRPGGRLPSRA